MQNAVSGGQWQLPTECKNCEEEICLQCNIKKAIVISKILQTSKIKSVRHKINYNLMLNSVK